MTDEPLAVIETRTQRFHALHAGPGLFVMPNPWDIGSARVLEGLGFPALATTSAGMAFTLGRPDGAVSREEALAHARAIVEATALPVSADLENGFGHAPEEVARTIREAGAVGLAGASIEDFSGDKRQPIYDLGHAVERVTAAVEAARDSRHRLRADRPGRELPARPARPRRHLAPPPGL